MIKMPKIMEDELLDIQELLFLALKSLRFRIDKDPIFVILNHC
jgi:hypothetical protein